MRNDEDRFLNRKVELRAGKTEMMPNFLSGSGGGGGDMVYMYISVYVSIHR